MRAKLSLHVPDQAVAIRFLDAQSDCVLGRDPACELALMHASVSRRHARLSASGNGWQLTDLGSKNGTRLDGARISSAKLKHGQWFAVGDVYCEFERIDAADQSRLQARAAERRHASAAWTARLRSDGDLQPLLGELLNGIVSVAECQRGFLLTPDASGQLRVAACFGLAPAELHSSAFSGSRSAVDRVQREHRPLYLSDARDRAWLKDRASILAQKITALVCLPLLHQGELLGIAYADTAEPAHVFTDLDAEVLTALVDHAGAVLAAKRLAAQLAQLTAWVAVDATGAVRPAGAAEIWGDASPP
jgi:hypothetical protein